MRSGNPVAALTAGSNNTSGLPLQRSSENTAQLEQARVEVSDFATPFIQSERANTELSDYAIPAVLNKEESHLFNVDAPPDRKYQALGRRLAQFGDLFRHPRHGSGLILVVDGIATEQKPVVKVKELLAVIADRLRITVIQGGKSKGGRIPAPEVATMLASEVFLQEFLALDRVIERPLYLPNFELTVPGYNHGVRGQRFYLRGKQPLIEQGTDTISRFLDALPFASNSDRTNAVGAALTVLLRTHLPGEKPFFPITGNKSHAGKGTVAAFIQGNAKHATVSYDPSDWAFQKNIVALFNSEPNLEVMNIDNIRLDKRAEVIRSAFLEQLLHEKEPLLHSSGTGKPLLVPAHFVFTATCNQGQFSTDLMNRAGGRIHLEARGDVHSRTSPIGDPKNEFLPQNRDRIEGELHGMIGRWKAEGRPLDESVKHAFGGWARMIGGILKVDGFGDFLRNRIEGQTQQDPVRNALGVLGCAYHGEWRTATMWALLIAKEGLVKQLIAPSDANSESGRTRGTGVVLTAHSDENLTVRTEDEVVTLRLVKERRRFEDGKPEWRYRFDVIERMTIPEDPETVESPLASEPKAE